MARRKSSAFSTDWRADRQAGLPAATAISYAIVRAAPEKARGHARSRNCEKKFDLFRPETAPRRPVRQFVITDGDQPNPNRPAGESNLKTNQTRTGEVRWDLFGAIGDFLDDVAGNGRGNG